MSALTLRRHSLITLLVGSLATSCVYLRVFHFGVPTLTTWTRFDNRPVVASSHPVSLPRAPAEARFDLVAGERSRYASLDTLLQGSRTRAFLAIHDDEIVYERYFGATSRETLLPAFSISKTYASLLVGVAVADGVLGPMSGSIETYVPELANRPRYDEVTLDDLLRMTSGIDFREESVDGAAMYYTVDLRSRMYLYGVNRTPGTHYEYGSINVQLLWDALDRRLGGRTVSDYFAMRVWDRLGAESPAEWSLDSEASGIEKFFGGFNATAGDHARLGLLFLHGGTLNGRTILPKEWVDEALRIDTVAGVVATKDGLVRRARYQWFLTLDGRAYFAKGYHGQYIFVVPDQSAVFVRFGDEYGSVEWPGLFERLADGMTRKGP